ncbi:RpiB/LacA/LacB family sugar-phosphate isomerase [Candidatus Woesearchaeota archaeon]|nr:RpiB/LacA/LacB family sugar-phosphate isomerase [Candidatus Woesearchaeota archaeon]
MKVIFGADHGGYKLKEVLKVYVKELGYEALDLGTDSEDSVDYPDYAASVSRKVAAGDGFGILVCRSAAGMVMAANKIRGIRAVAAFDVKSAKHSKEHNDANVLALSGDWLTDEQAKAIVKAWLETPFSNEPRHAKRIRKIMALES